MQPDRHKIWTILRFIVAEHNKHSENHEFYYDEPFAGSPTMENDIRILEYIEGEYIQGINNLGVNKDRPPNPRLCFRKKILDKGRMLLRNPPPPPIPPS